MEGGAARTSALAPNRKSPAAPASRTDRAYSRRQRCTRQHECRCRPGGLGSPPIRQTCARQAIGTGSAVTSRFARPALPRQQERATRANLALPPPAGSLITQIPGLRQLGPAAYAHTPAPGRLSLIAIPQAATIRLDQPAGHATRARRHLDHVGRRVPNDRNARRGGARCRRRLRLSRRPLDDASRMRQDRRPFPPVVG
jgi:hypothetical protein